MKRIHHPIFKRYQRANFSATFATPDPPDAKYTRSKDPGAITSQFDRESLDRVRLKPPLIPRRELFQLRFDGLGDVQVTMP